MVRVNVLIKIVLVEINGPIVTIMSNPYVIFRSFLVIIRSAQVTSSTNYRGVRRISYSIIQNTLEGVIKAIKSVYDLQ